MRWDPISRPELTGLGHIWTCHNCRVNVSVSQCASVRLDACLCVSIRLGASQYILICLAASLCASLHLCVHFSTSLCFGVSQCTSVPLDTSRCASVCLDTSRCDLIRLDTRWCVSVCLATCRCTSIRLYTSQCTLVSLIMSRHVLVRLNVPRCVLVGQYASLLSRVQRTLWWLHHRSSEDINNYCEEMDLDKDEAVTLFHSEFVTRPHKTRFETPYSCMRQDCTFLSSARVSRSLRTCYCPVCTAPECSSFL